MELSVDFKIIYQHDSSESVDKDNLKLTAKAKAHALIEQYVGISGISSLNAKICVHKEFDHLLYEVVVDLNIDDKSLNLLKISKPKKYDEFRILTHHKLLRLGLF